VMNLRLTIRDLTPRPKIKITDRVDRSRGTRTVSVTVPLAYPGLSAREQDMLDQGLAAIKEAFESAQRRLDRDATARQRGR